MNKVIANRHCAISGTVLIIDNDFPSTFEVEFVEEMNESLPGLD